MILYRIAAFFMLVLMVVTFTLGAPSMAVLYVFGNHDYTPVTGYVSDVTRDRGDPIRTARGTYSFALEGTERSLPFKVTNARHEKQYFEIVCRADGRSTPVNAILYSHLNTEQILFGEIPTTSKLIMRKIGVVLIAAIAASLGVYIIRNRAKVLNVIRYG